MPDFQHNIRRFTSLCLLAAVPMLGLGCTDKLKDAAKNIDTGDISDVAKGLAKQCGLSCPDKGVLDGNSTISGIASVDGFFAAVVNYQTTADSVSGGIEAQLDVIKGDLGLAANADVAAELDTKVAAYLDGGLQVQAEPAKCVTDVKAVVRAEANCDATVDPGSAMVMCKGSCQADASASASCDASADLQCTTSAPSVTCTGSCQGSCTAQLTAAAKCDGTCSGSCTGDCSAYVQNDKGDFVCAGACDGNCKGSCTAELAAGAECKGSCDGQCTVTNPSAGCTGAVQVSCKAKANASVMCSGRCDGDFDPPKAKAECQASAQAQAKVSVECTPPRLAVHYKLKAVAKADVDAQTAFVASLDKVEAHLPALLASIEHAKRVASAGEALSTSASGAVKTSFQAATKGDLSTKQTIGLGCAIDQLGRVDEAINTPNERLMTNLDTCASLQTSLGLSS